MRPKKSLKKSINQFGLTHKLNRSIRIKGQTHQDWLKSNVTGVEHSSSVCCSVSGYRANFSCVSPNKPRSSLRNSGAISAC